MAFTRVRGPGITTDDNYRVGIITASKFVGPIETTVDSDFTNINVTGISTVDGVKIGDPSGIVTASSSSGIVTYYGDASKLTGLTAGQIPNLDGAKITSGTVAAARIDNLAASKITSGTVATARLGSGTANNTSFLRGDQTWASNTSTTINSNTNNYLITGTGTADTLQGESGLTYNGSRLDLTGDLAVSTANRIYFGNSDVAWVKGEHGGSGYLQFGVNTEHVRLLRSGNLGIGTDNPAKKLEVWDATQGVIRIRGGGGGSNSSRKADLSLFASGAREYVVRVDASDAAFKIIDVSGSNAERLTITSAGLVGIGTAVPDQTLELFKASGTNLVKVTSQANSTIGLEIEKTGATTQSWRIADGQTVNGKLEFYDVTDSATRMCIDGAGRILINRTSQHASSSERLSVNGMTSIQYDSTSAAGLYIFNEETTTSGNPVQPFIYCHDGSGIRSGLGVQRSTGLTILNGQFGLSFRTGASGVGGTERLRITSAGNLEKKSGGSYFAYNTNGYYAKQDNYDNNGGKSYWYDGASGNSNIVASIDGETGNIRAGGKLLVGTTNTSSQLVVNSAGATNAVSIRNTTGGNGVVGILFSTQDHSGGREKAGIFHQETHGQAHYGGDFVFALNTATGGAAQVTVSDRKARLSRHGHWMVGTDNSGYGTNSNEGQGAVMRGDGQIVSRRDATMFTAKSLATGGYVGLRLMSAQTEVGTIIFNSGGTSFNTSSDYRRKENVVSITDGITKVKQLKTYRFNFKDNPSETVDGFLAHEAQEVIPHAVHGTKDKVATAEDVTAEKATSVGDPIYQQMDQSKLVPLLTAALQEAITKIETLETKVAALESS